jgi:hypothetical protein
MIGNCPVKRVMEDALFPKHSCHETESCEKPCREDSCLNDRIRSRQTAAGSIAREEQIDAEGDCRYRGWLFEQEGRAQKRTCWEEFGSQSRRTAAERDCPRPDDREIHEHLAIECESLPGPPGLENTVEERGNQTGIAIKQLAADHIKAGHRA